MLEPTNYETQPTNLKEQTMNETTLTTTQRVRNYAIQNPTATSAEIAAATGATRNRVNVILWDLRVKGLIPQSKLSLKRRTKAKAKARAKGKTKVKAVEPQWQTAAVVSSSTPIKANDPVNHPAHYKTGGIETIDFIEAKKLNYNLGNVVKYITRADHKGNRKQDLEKALWYLNREIGKL